MESPNNSKSVYLYDTTLRDGTQRKGLSLTLEDKLRVARLLDDFGVHYIEGGWPGSNPKDQEFFSRLKSLRLQTAKVAAFGSTCKVGSTPAKDNNIACLVAAQTPAVTIVGKSSRLHVERIIESTAEENQRIISESVSYLKLYADEVIFDAEHFFDGYAADHEFSLNAIKAAFDAGADWIVLCDTNGRTMPEQISDTVSAVIKTIGCKVGVHTHNDSELAVANALSAVRAGARQIQGTINGYGERCGNANLISIVPNLQLKMGYECLPPERLRHLTDLSRTVSEIANLQPDPYAPYVGAFAFAHKGGLHAAAVEKLSSSYEHIDPEIVGNTRQVVVSELSGRGNIRLLASQLELEHGTEPSVILSKIKDLESQGFQFENAEGTVELMIRRDAPDYKSPFELIDMRIASWQQETRESMAEAVVKVKVGDVVFHTAAEGNGPVNALDEAMRKALLPAYPQLAAVKLADYKVRIINPQSGTMAITRVTIEATDGERHWFTVGASSNIIDASYQALADSLELYLTRYARKKEEVIA